MTEILNVCVVTGTRAEFGLLRPLLEKISHSSLLRLQLIVTGMHLSPEFGLTYSEIDEAGFSIDRRIENLLSSDTPVGTTKSMGLGLIGFADAYAELKPDIVLVLGDRFETFVAATAALIAIIPIIHLHGGELTEGAFDDALRHSITKMSHFHFVATSEYRDRVIKLGEHPSRVHHVGSLGVEAIHKLSLIDKPSIEQQLNITFLKHSLLVTFHPETLSQASPIDQLRELFMAFDKLSDTTLIFTLPNADTSGRALIAAVNEYCVTRPYAYSFASLGQLRYLSLMKHVDAVVGNSSSGLIEAPALKKPSINIGNRQKGRLRAPSVIDCEPSLDSITKALDQLRDPVFIASLENLENPYYLPNTSQNILSKIESLTSTDFLPKTFYE